MEERIFTARRLAAALCAWAAMVFAPASPGHAAQCKPPSVLMILPDRPDNPFWGPYADFAASVADSLGIPLTVEYTVENDRFDYMERLQRSLSGSEKPDYIAVFPYLGAVPLLMQEASRSGTQIVTLNADLGQGDREAVGYPRERYKNWILQSLADDESAGFDLARAVTDAARARFGLSESETVRLSAIGGNQLAAASLLRRDGLVRFAGGAAAPVSINQFVFTDWSYERGSEVAAGLLRRYQPTHAVWTASLPLGLAAVDAWTAAAGPAMPAIGVVSGPFDERALAGIDGGTFSAVLGGHFFEGGILLVLLLDHFNGLDFVDDIGTGLRIPFETVDKGNIADVRAVLGDRVWRGRNFTHLSKCHDAARRYYDFSMRTVLR